MKHVKDICSEKYIELLSVSEGAPYTLTCIDTMKGKMQVYPSKKAK